MAWIAKQSATMQIDRRVEPYLTEQMRTELRDKILPRYEQRMGALLPALHMIQHAYGWIPAQAMEEIATELDIPAADVMDTATFYEEYWLKPKGRNLIAVCRSIACEFCGAGKVTEAVKDKLGIDVGETTDDEAFTLVELECVGSCGTAPAILINETLHEDVTPEQIGKLIDEARKGGAGH
ncbi:MAG: NADH-quinone oxidoreductase subunit NuoE [Phycisphaerales bacterium JB039]